MRVVLAEGSLLLRAGIARMLDDAGFDVVAQTGDGEDLVRKVRGHRPDVAVIDIRFDAAVRTIRAELPEVGVLVLSQEDASDSMTGLLERGPQGLGYMLTNRVAELDRFADAIRELARGGSVLDPEVLTHMLSRRRRSGPLDGLTPREHEVLARMAQGETNRAIARGLFVSERAVERHVTAIFDKLRLRASEAAHRRVLAVLAYQRYESIAS